MRLVRFQPTMQFSLQEKLVGEAGQLVEVGEPLQTRGLGRWAERPHLQQRVVAAGSDSLYLKAGAPVDDEVRESRGERAGCACPDGHAAPAGREDGDAYALQRPEVAALDGDRRIAEKPK